MTIQHEIITTSQQRVRSYPWKHVSIPPLVVAVPGSPEVLEWQTKNWWTLSYEVHEDNKCEAERMVAEMHQVWSVDQSSPLIEDLLDRLYRLRRKDEYTMVPKDTWEHGAYQLTKYHGCDLILTSLWKELSEYKGEVLEAMCGHISYFSDAEDRTVTALDYCKPSLERYPFPNRRRICCDLDRVRNGATLPFESDVFDVISICFGFKYPEDLHSLGIEFRRIIKPGGILSFIENPTHQYRQLIKREFSPDLAKEILLSCGFERVKVHIVPIRDETIYNGTFFHVEAFV